MSSCFTNCKKERKFCRFICTNSTSLCEHETSRWDRWKNTVIIWRMKLRNIIQTPSFAQRSAQAQSDIPRSIKTDVSKWFLGRVSPLISNWYLCRVGAFRDNTHDIVTSLNACHIGKFVKITNPASLMSGLNGIRVFEARKRWTWVEEWNRRRHVKSPVKNPYTSGIH